ncbi:hypothetical protein [Chitinilyticum litopenaei]|uniref:hypothetical protein n=1 Tax=Chitinilyticum litopenaei TaxID=1121276 RepID=UPI00048A76F7|nr:hypothetical protein [Chitinilyticum litopenaei]
MTTIRIDVNIDEVLDEIDTEDLIQELEHRARRGGRDYPGSFDIASDEEVDRALELLRRAAELNDAHLLHEAARDVLWCTKGQLIN